MCVMRATHYTHMDSLFLFSDISVQNASCITFHASTNKVYIGGFLPLHLQDLKKKKKMFLPHPRVKVSIVGSLRDREVACSASDRQGSNCESCVWTTVSSQSSHHPQEVLLAQFSLYVHKGGLKPDSFHYSGIKHVSYGILRIESNEQSSAYISLKNVCFLRVVSV